jgi:hypothetical protein
MCIWRKTLVVLVGCLCLAGCGHINIPSGHEIENNPKWQQFREDHFQVYNKAERFRIDKLNTFEHIYGHRQRGVPALGKN